LTGFFISSAQPNFCGTCDILLFYRSGSHAQIGGEDPRLFLAGLAYALGVIAPRAATIVCAAVAARTRLWFLQAWVKSD